MVMKNRGSVTFLNHSKSNIMTTRMTIINGVAPAREAGTWRNTSVSNRVSEDAGGQFQQYDYRHPTDRKNCSKPTLTRVPSRTVKWLNAKKWCEDRLENTPIKR